MLKHIVPFGSLVATLVGGNPIKRNDNEYEYIVVGSGPGGGPLVYVPVNA